jgi:hypothetical protein
MNLNVIMLVFVRVIGVGCDLFEWFGGIFSCFHVAHSIPRRSWRWARGEFDPCYFGSGIVDNYRTGDSNIVMLFIM